MWGKKVIGRRMTFSLWLVGLIAGALVINPVTAAEPTLSLAPVNPDVASGRTVELSAWLNNESGQAQEVTAYTAFSHNDPSGSLIGSTYYAGQAGQWTVIGHYGELTASTSVTVLPGPITQLVINPNSQPEVIALNSSRSFKATAYDAQNNIISPVAFAWRLEGLVGTIDTSGKLSATNSGTGKVIAESNGVSASVDVVVRATAVSNTNQSNANSATANSNAQANANSNTNGTAVNESTNSQATNESAEATPTESETAGACTALAWWWWLIFLIVYLALVYGYYFLIRGSRNRWWWIAPLGLTVAAVWLYFGLRCESVATWFPWVTVIGGLILTVFRPMRFTPTDGNPL